MRTVISILAVLFLAGCATQAAYDSDHGNPIYHRGGNRVQFPGIMRSLTGGNREEGDSSSRDTSSNDESVSQAVSGLIVSGVSLVLNQDYYKSAYLGGHCLCGTGIQSMEYPCSSVTVVLKDRSGREVSRLTSDDGEFVFPVVSGQAYYLAVDSERYFLTKDLGPIGRGDDVVLHLEMKATAKSMRQPPADG